MTIAAKKTSTLSTAETLRDGAVDYVNAAANSAGHAAAAMEDRVAHKISDMADAVSGKLKTVGIDTTVMADLAKDEASELQRMLADQLKNHPARTLGIAAALGLVVGFMTKR